MTSKEVSGKEASSALNQAGIVTNANAIPFDPRKPFDPSGVRIGTPAATTRGLGAEHMGEIARWFDEVVGAVRSGESELLARVKTEVQDLMEQYPAPGCASSAAVL